MLELDTLLCCASRHHTSDPPSYDDDGEQHSELVTLVRQAEAFGPC